MNWLTSVLCAVLCFTSFAISVSRSQGHSQPSTGAAVDSGVSRAFDIGRESRVSGWPDGVPFVAANASAIESA